METPTGAEYDNSHRAFLQAFLARGSMTFAQARSILAASMTAASPDDRETLPNDVTEADLNNYIAIINGMISPFDLEFRSTIAQTPRQQQQQPQQQPQNGDRPTTTRIYALVNTTSDAITQLATTHSPDEIAFVKRVLDEMFIGGCTRRQELYAVPAMKAVNCNTAPSSSSSSFSSTFRNRQNGSGVNGNYNNNNNNSDDDQQQQQQATAAGQIQSITKHQAESLLDTLVTEGWFECSRRRFYILAPRALMELRGWLMETYNDDYDDNDEEDGDDDMQQQQQQQQRIKLCAACRDIVTVGQRCPDLDCKGRLHEHCTTTMWRSQGGAERCPVCKKRWEGFGFVGEKVVTSSSRVSNAGAGDGGGGGGAAAVVGERRRVEDAVVEEDEGDGEEGEEEEEEEEEEE